MKKPYEAIEELAWRLDSVCHKVIEWAERKRGEPDDFTAAEFIRSVATGMGGGENDAD